MASSSEGVGNLVDDSFELYVTAAVETLVTQLMNARKRINELDKELENERTLSAKLGTVNEELKAKLGTAEKRNGELDRDLATEKTNSDDLTTSVGELQTQLGEALKHNQRLTSRIEANNPKPSIKCCLGHIVVYFLVAAPICYFNYQSFTGMDSGNILTNALYFAVATCLSVGYGDIHPKTTASKLITCVLVVYGAHISNCLIVVQSYIWDKLKAKFLQNVSETKRTIIIALLTLAAVLISIFGGMWGIYVYENGKNVDKIKEYKLNATDSFYLSMMSLSTEGFGDFSFKTVHGRVFAVFWLLFFQPFYVFAMTHLMKLVALATRHFLPGCF